jgi:phage shock protein C
MICSNCQCEIADSSNFCSNCGARQHVSRNAYKRLLRSPVDRKIAGVCGGIAEYLEIDSTVVRLVWLLLLLVPVPLVPAIAAYLIAWIVIPPAPVPVKAVSSKSAVPPPVVPNSPQGA